MRRFLTLSISGVLLICQPAFALRLPAPLESQPIRAGLEESLLGREETYIVGHGIPMEPEQLAPSSEPGGSSVWGNDILTGTGTSFLVESYVTRLHRAPSQAWLEKAVAEGGPHQDSGNWHHWVVRIEEGSVSVVGMEGFRLNENHLFHGCEQVMMDPSGWERFSLKGNEAALTLPESDSSAPFVLAHVTRENGNLRIRMTPRQLIAYVLYPLARFEGFKEAPSLEAFGIKTEWLTRHPFMDRYNSLFHLGKESDKEVWNWVDRPDFSAAVLDLPSTLTVYAHSRPLYQVVHSRLRQPPGNDRFWKIRQLPETEEEARSFQWDKLAIILKNSMLSEVPLINPQNLYVKEVFPLDWDIAQLNPIELLAEFFRSRLGIPYASYLGARLIEEEGKERLFLFFT